MRIATNTIYSQGVSAMQTQQAQVLHVQQQISTNRRVVTPADDPIASSQVLQLQQSVSLNDQYTVNRNSASASLGLSETALDSSINILQSIRDTAVQAGNGIMTQSDRATLAQTLQQQYNELLSVANTQDGDGKYIFSGGQTSTQPFAQGTTGVTYSGDDSQRLLQVSNTQQLATNYSGADVFQRIRNGNGQFIVQAGTTNSGTGVATQGSVTDPTAVTGDSYKISFTVTPNPPNADTITYDVTDTTTSTSVATAQPYTDGNAITINGQTINISGTPATGDSFTVAPSTNQDVFTTIQNLINTLKASGTTASANAQYANNSSLAISNLDLALDHLNTVRSDVGAKQAQIDDLTSSGQDLGVQYKTVISQLQDVDYTSAVTQLTQYQTALDAAQKSFSAISGKSLFDYL